MSLPAVPPRHKSEREKDEEIYNTVGVQAQTKKKGPCDRMNRPPGTNRTSTTYTTNNWQSRNNTYKSMRTRTNAHMNASHTQIRTCRNACTHTHTNTHTHARAKRRRKKQHTVAGAGKDRRQKGHGSFTRSSLCRCSYAGKDRRQKGHGSISRSTFCRCRYLLCHPDIKAKERKMKKYIIQWACKHRPKKGTVRSDEPPARHEPHTHNIQNEQLAVKKPHIQENTNAHERTNKRITNADTNMQKLMHTHENTHTNTRTNALQQKKKIG